MNDLSEYLFLGGMLVALCGVATARVLLALWGQYKFEREYRKLPRVVKYNQYQACPSTHNWQEFKLAVRDLEPGNYKVCMDCGSIAGNFQHMVSNELLDQAREVLRKQAAKQERLTRLESRVAALVDHRVTEYMLREFPRESNDPTFINKLTEFSEFVLDTRDEVVDRVTTEMETEELTGVKSDQSGDMRGNA